MLSNGRTSLPGSVLLIENDLALRGGLVELLGFADMTCLDTPSGREGVRIFETHQNDIDLVIMDMGWLDKNGDIVVQELEALRPDVKVVIISSYDKERLALQFEAHPNVAVMQKPFNAYEFLDVVKTSLFLSREPYQAFAGMTLSH